MVLLRLAVVGTLVAGLCPVIGVSASAAQDRPPGITDPVVFPAFNPSASLCTPPIVISQTLAYVQENDRECLEGVNYGLTLAAGDRCWPGARG